MRRTGWSIMLERAAANQKPSWHPKGPSAQIERAARESRHKVALEKRARQELWCVVVLVVLGAAIATLLMAFA